MRIPRIAASAVLVLGLGAGVVACSEDAADLSDEELRTKLIEVLTDDATLEPAQAECTIDYLFENMERDDLNQLANAEDESDATEEQVQVLTDGLFSCL